jgi:hypothetical protein
MKRRPRPYKGAEVPNKEGCSLVYYTTVILSMKAKHSKKSKAIPVTGLGGL